MYARSKLTTSSAAVERGGLAKCCHALRTHQHAQGGRVAARPSGRGNEAASSEPSIYSVRTVERIIGHSLHGQSRGSGVRASERGGGLPAFPRGLRPDTFQVESILGVRRSFCILSAPSRAVPSPHPLALTRFPFMPAPSPTCPHALSFTPPNPFL